MPIILTENEKCRFDVISLCLKRAITNKQATTSLQRSIRQVQRIKVAIRIHGVKGAIMA